jgi:two-component system, OmpR family, sensor kinase
MLTIARHEAGQLRLNLRDADLRLVLSKAAELFPHDVSIQLPDSPVQGNVDAVRLRQSILAVFQNARRYGGPHIRARLEALETTVRFVIEDNGPGMSDAEKSHAFERFFRGSNAAGQAAEGIGLGLPIVKSILEAHGGSVWLEDVDTGGLRVILDLPQVPRIAIVNGSEGNADRRRARQ